MPSQRKFAVAGGTGRLGRHVVELLEADGHDVVSMSRSSGVDVISGQGLEEALAGVECIIDAATGASPDENAATAFFTAEARNLQKFGERAGVRRIVVVSIIGIDRSNVGGYYAAKRAHERLTLSGPIPARVLRAAQFHEFVPVLMEWGRKGDVVYVPKMRTQLVAAKTVARALIGMAGEPDSKEAPGSSTPFPEIAGPREENLADCAKLFAARRGDQVRIEEVSDPADPHHVLYETGGLLPGPGAVLAGPTFAEWLESEFSVTGRPLTEAAPA